MKLLRARKIGFLFGLLIFVSCVVANGSYEEPIKVEVCQLKNDPAAYNHILVQVTGFISHGFENFTLFDPGCQSVTSVWLEYGGTAAAPTNNFFGVTADAPRPKPHCIHEAA